MPRERPAADSAPQTEPRKRARNGKAEDLPQSSFLGVFWDRRMRKWRAKANGVHVGYFDEETAAGEAVDIAKLSKVRTGDPSPRLNFPQHHAAAAAAAAAGAGAGAPSAMVAVYATTPVLSIAAAPTRNPLSSALKGFNGVWLDSYTGLFHAAVLQDGTVWNLGEFHLEMDAARAFDLAVRASNLSHDVLNFPELNFSELPLSPPPPHWTVPSSPHPHPHGVVLEPRVGNGLLWNARLSYSFHNISVGWLLVRHAG